MSEVTQSWDPTIAGQEVRIRANPGLRGVTTGKVQRMGTRLLVQIQFGPNEKSYKPYSLLEPCGQTEDVPTLFQQGRFGGADDLRRILSFEKVKGHLTNVFYSMEASNTDFFPHQFKPVLKFLESPTGRLLIADEVGLGKTIEALYIWKELQARADARRLLILCPAVLRQKWRDDLRQRFNIIAEITDAQGLLNKLRGVLEHDSRYPFVCIASLEGLRPSSNWDNELAQGARAELARLLDRHPATDETSLFDLVVVDEAHYLRNPATANHRIGQLLRDAARHFILLTATPIQLHSNNLYQLLRLISPEDFFDPLIFQEMLTANRPVVNALRLIWNNPPDYSAAQQELKSALHSPYFRSNPILHQICQTLDTPEAMTLEDQVRLGYKLESASLVSQYITRSRKRDVLPNRVERAPQTLKVAFSPLEQEIYQAVTQRIRQQARGAQGVSLFRLIARQRQMASCMAAALEAWSSQGILPNLLQEDEQLWEDFGVLADPQKPELCSDLALAPSTFDFKALEQQDTKYHQLVQFLKQELKKSPSEKFVLFAYFRGTLHYLQRRLQSEGISTGLIMGEMGEEKWNVIREFQNGTTAVLLSSEVGSEGIDLQFCRFLINYDLPWNPMRVEQRIGRLDRLGQKAERISIINFGLQNTIEERILERLYERIDIFRESIGDLEEILGEMTDQLLLALFEADLTEVERQQKADEAVTTLLKQQVEQERLEHEAINMFAFSDFLLTAINQGRDQGRWLHPQELESFVEDYFARHYPGTTIEPVRDKPHAAQIALSEAAKTDLEEFIRKHRFATPTLLSKLSNQPITCFFDPKAAKELLGRASGKRSELLDPTHPLIQWIRQNYEAASQKFHPISAIQLNQSPLNLPLGLYIYIVHRWTFTGLRNENRLAYKVIRCRDGSLLSDDLSEQLVNYAARQGQPKLNAIHLLPEFEQILECFQICNEDLEVEFGQFATEFESENTNRCDVQQKSAEDYAKRKRQELEERLQRLRLQGKSQIIPATEGLLRKVNRELELKLRTVKQKREVSLDLVQLAAGVLFLV
jgi:superfamily II DNA or RNA helicase